MAEEKNTISEKAELTYDAQKVECGHCEEFLFHLKDTNHEFTIGLTDVLKCLQFAEEQGAVPPFSDDWWVLIHNHFQF